MKKDIFIKEYSEKLKCEKASLFIGSGISRKSGYANWKDILRECAEEINLDVDKESDLITLAEFYVKGKQRTKIDQTIASYFKDKNGEPCITHRILSTFPVKSIWTTNYDTLIERSLAKADISYSVVTNDESYVSLDPTAKVKVHKIHGDINNPSRCVITRKDYEKFEETHDIVLSELKGEMCTNSFLFLGYSFSDIDIQHILSKIRLIYNDDHPQRHYCIMEKIKKENCEDENDFLYKENRQNHYINDMQSYGLNVVLVDSYDEIENILREISIRVHLKDILVSGAYEEANTLSKNRISPFATSLAQKLIEEDFRIITGYGKNLGSDVVAGAFLGCCNVGIQPKDFNENVILCPFPYKLPDSSNRSAIYTSLRENMVSKTRISIFICGEKYAKGSKSPIHSPGVLEEYRISKEQGNLIIPLATTGGAARTIWDIEQNELSFSTRLEGFQKLETEVDPEKLVDIVISMIQEYSTNRTDDVYKGEDDGEDLSQLTEDAIWAQLKDRIYDSTLTIVLISPNMKERLRERDQWIPWEVSYSLKEVSRKNKAGNMVISSSNAILAIILPNRSGSYTYFLEDKRCCSSGCRLLKTNTLFTILRKNMFNVKLPEKNLCSNNEEIYHGDSSYIYCVKWKDFIETPALYIEKAYHLQNSIEQYDIYKEIE